MAAGAAQSHGAPGRNGGRRTAAGTPPAGLDGCNRGIDQLHGIQHIHPAGSHRARDPDCAFPKTASSLRPLAALGVILGGVAAFVSAYAMSALENNATVSTWQMAAAHTLTAFAATAVLLGVLGTQHSFLKHRALIYLGKISYGLYVIHELAHLLAKQIFPAASPLRVVGQSGISLAITIALAAASYRWLETPFLRLKEKFAHVQSRPV